MSVSWKASCPRRLVLTCAVRATMGVESMKAVAIPVTRLVAPGPDVAMQTPTFPGSARVAVGSMGRCLFMPHEIMTDLTVHQPVMDRQGVCPRVSEDYVNSFLS